MPERIRGFLKAETQEEDMSEKDNRTYWVEIYVPGRGLELREEAVLARDPATGRIAALGTAAREQQAAGAEMISPFRDGQIAEWNDASMMFRYFISQVWKKKFRKFQVLVCLYPGGTGVERKAMEEAMFYAGAKKVEMTEKSVDRVRHQNEAQGFDFILAVRSEEW